MVSHSPGLPCRQSPVADSSSPSIGMTRSDNFVLGVQDEAPSPHTRNRGGNLGGHGAGGGPGSSSFQGGDGGGAECEANLETDAISNALQILDDTSKEMRAIEFKLIQQRVNSAMLTVELATLLDPVSREQFTMTSQGLSEAAGDICNGQAEEYRFKENLMSFLEDEPNEEPIPQEPQKSETQEDPKFPEADRTCTKDTEDGNYQEVQVQEQHDVITSVSPNNESLLQEHQDPIETDAQMPSSDSLPQN
ncbi:hypothetical protein Pcinc_029037 [Petrolisthes cinctipes]|uniref:Uncharacterized protein n=1 Tax=Petrolisthes cinctipes TaxID=88211 RepID=A0AAE1F169_PETCI|nr:hypothetical protein Pcinc_029037 [Petrolisthes cinctipes]